MRSFAFVATFLAAALIATAQTPSASVVGRVTDPTGAVIPGVTVKVTNLDTKSRSRPRRTRSAISPFPYLNPGRYMLEAASTGFRTYKHSEFSWRWIRCCALDIPLEVGAATESVTVTERRPCSTPRAARAAKSPPTRRSPRCRSTAATSPILRYLTGGVIPKGDGGDGQYAVNGARADNIGFLVDGMNNTQRRNTGPVVNLPIEGVQEFKMMTSGYSAEYGRYAGGVLSVVTKSGTNRLRGALYEFLRNDVFDATGYFDGEKSKLRRNQFGATVTGPVYMPKIYDGRNRTFFMFTLGIAARRSTARRSAASCRGRRCCSGDFSQAPRTRSASRSRSRTR